MARRFELLPCPFCGAQPHNDPTPCPTNTRVKSVTCGSCGAEGPARRKAENAAEAWNQRVKPATER